MPIPGNGEPGASSGQQPAQQQQSINFSSAIPIKKRRFPTIQPSSPSPEEKPPISEGQDSKNKQESNITGEGLSLSDARNTGSPSNSDVSRTPTVTVKKEVTSTSEQLGLADADIFASRPLEVKPSISLGDLGNEKDILQNEKSSDPEVPDSCMGAPTAIVKQETVSGQIVGSHRLELSTAKMNVELSLGPKEPLVSAVEHQNREAICLKSDKSDSSLSLALPEEKLVLHETNDSSIDNVSNRACANRSNWDLNTTMDVWEGSSLSNAFGHKLGDTGGFSKTSSCHDDKSLLTTPRTVGDSLNKGKHTSDGHIFSSSDASLQTSQQCKTDDSLGLKLDIPFMDTSRDHSSLSDNLGSSGITPGLNLQRVQLTVTNTNRSVKSEPVDDNSKRDSSSVGSCSSSNMEVLKFSSVKSELARNHRIETVLPSSLTLVKLVDGRLMKSEVVLERNQEVCKSKDATVLQSAGSVMQHQESSASSSALPVPLMAQNPCPSRLSTCSELTSGGDLSNKSEQSFHSRELHNNDTPDEPIASVVSEPVSQDSPCKIGNLSVINPEKCELDRVDEQTFEVCQYSEGAANDEEKINLSTEMVEEDSFGSDCESQQHCAVDTICHKEDEEYEDGEIREVIQHSAGEDPIVEVKKTEKLELVQSDSGNLQPFVPMEEQNINAPDFEGKDAVKKNLDETSCDTITDCVGVNCDPNSEDNSCPELSDKVLEVAVDEKKSISVNPDEQLDMSEEDVQDSPEKERSTDVPTDRGHGIGVELGDEATDKIVKENCSGEDGSTLSKVEASLNGQDVSRDLDNVGNKSRIINLSRASVVTTPCKTKSIPNRLLTSRSGKERYSDLDGGTQPRGNRDEFFPNKFVKDRVHDQPFRNSRPNFMHGKGRISGRFGPLRSEWDSDRDFASETSYGPSDYRVMRRKHAPSIPDVELDCNGYGIPQDGTALGGNRRKVMNDEFPSLHRTSLRRLSSGDRDGPVTRGIPMLHRIPRNMSPRRCPPDPGSDVIGHRHDDKFMRHLSDDIISPLYNRPQNIYDSLDSQVVRGNRNFSTLQRKGYPRIRSRSRTRSPGPWSSPRRRSRNGLPELTQHRSPPLFRTGRMRSPDRACYRDEMVARRRGSPSYGARHSGDLRDVDSGREHVHPRSPDSNRRSSPGRVFPRSTRRADAIDSREMGDGNEYMNGPLHSNKHELHGDGSIDERRKFLKRRGPLRSFQPSYSNDNDNFRFHPNDGPRPYRFCPDADTEFVERSNMRDREFDERIKHQSLAVPHRIRNFEEQQDGNYRPVERVWHDDGFSDARVKRRRF